MKQDFESGSRKQNETVDIKRIFTFWFAESVCHLHSSWLACCKRTSAYGQVSKWSTSINLQQATSVSQF